MTSLSPCAICLEGYNEKSPLVTLDCGGRHAFHEACVQKYLSTTRRETPLCPLCRRTFTPLPGLRDEEMGLLAQGEGGLDAVYERWGQIMWKSSKEILVIFSAYSIFYFMFYSLNLSDN